MYIIITVSLLLLYCEICAQAEFGAPGSPAFEAARQNFIASEAGYAVASFLLQVRAI